MTINTTALEESQYLVANLFQTPIKIRKTFVAGDVFYYDSIGELSQDIISSTYGKYSSNVSLLDALLETRADEKKFEV
jgi:hypothetical protein